jgi:hypothetical protein
MGWLGLVLVVAWLVIVAGVRGYLHARRTGSVGLRGGDPRGSPQWWSRLNSSPGVVLAFDPDARTALVTTGPFRVVRNPTLTGTMLTAVGLAGWALMRSSVPASSRVASSSPDA